MVPILNSPVQFELLTALKSGEASARNKWTQGTHEKSLQHSDIYLGGMLNVVSTLISDDKTAEGSSAANQILSTIVALFN